MSLIDTLDTLDTLETIETKNITETIQKKEEIIIQYNSREFNCDFFKKKEKSNLLLLIRKEYVKYIESPFDKMMTLKINLTKRLALYHKFIKNLLEIIFPVPFVNNIIKTYIGLTVNNVYINIDNYLKLIEPVYHKKCKK